MTHVAGGMVVAATFPLPLTIVDGNGLTWQL